MNFTKFCVVLALVLGLSTGSELMAQHCGHQDYMDHLERMHPGLKGHVDQTYLEAVRQAKTSSLYKLASPDTIFTIQVVFHVVYNTSGQNLSDALIHNQIRILNEAYNRENADTVNTREIFKPVAGSARIRFVLASKDPQGNFTTGITQTQTTLTTFNANGNASQTDNIKSASTGGVDAWPTNEYLNIWVGNLNRLNGTRALFGYAYPPVGAAFWSSSYYRSDPYQGVVLHYEVVGKDNPSNLSDALYTNEKTAVHEVGHYLGLRHVWGDATWGQNGCLVDDYIDDTPNAARASSGCTYGVNTCPGDEFPDQLENYMDYSSATCSNMFTKQQIAVMRHNLVNLRPGLAQAEFTGHVRPNIASTRVYPNPFSSELKLYMHDASEEMVTIMMHDMLGRLVLESSQRADVYVISVNTDALVNGVYVVKAISEKTGLLVEGRVIKSH